MERCVARRGMLTVEVLLAAALLAAALVPALGLLQANHREAWGDENQLLAHRRATAALAALEPCPYDELAGAAAGDAPPPVLAARVGDTARELLLDGAAGVDLSVDEGVRRMRARTWFEELEPGLARLAVLVTWTDPASGADRRVVVCRFLEDPFCRRAREEAPEAALPAD